MIKIKKRIRNKRFVQKFFSNYSREARTVARVLETTFPQSNELSFFNDIHTIQIIKTEEEEFNPDKITLFEIESQKVLKGYLDAPNAKKLNLISNKKKLVKNISSSYYHAIADDLAEISYALTLYPDAEIIINISQIEPGIKKSTWDFIGFFLDQMTSKGIKYRLVDISKFDIVYLNNFAQLQFPFTSGAKLDTLLTFLESGLEHPKETPYRKVFVSRKLAPQRPESKESRVFSYPDDSRIDSHENIEKFFKDLGFEVVYPESFKNFQEQIDYFYSTKILASLTSSGIGNAIFMQPGGTVIEISTPLIVQSPMVTNEELKRWNLDPKTSDLDLNVTHEIHMFYHNLSLFKDHLYVSIPNIDRDSNKIKDFIYSNPTLRKFLTDEPTNYI